MFERKGKKNIKKLRISIENVVTANAPKNTISGLAVCRQYVLGRYDQISSAPGAIKAAAQYDDDLDYERAAYNMVYNICESGLASGSLNIYRGLLSPVGEEVFFLYKELLQKFVKNEWISKEDSINAYKNVKSGIESFG